MQKEKTLQRPMEITQPEKASSSQDATGYLPSGEIPGVSTANTTGRLPSGKIPGAQAAESTEDLPSGEISVKEAKEEDVEMNSTQDDEEVPQDERMQDVEEVDYGGSDEETEEKLLHYELKRIDEEIHKDKDRRQETHQQQCEAEGRQEQQQDMKEEEHAVPTTVEEVKVYQEELKKDNFGQPSSAEYFRLLKNDTKMSTTESQVKMETIFVEQGIKKSKKPFQRKIQTSLDRPLEREPRVKVSVPKPMPRGEEQDIIEHEAPLDELMFLDKENQSRTFGFYGKNFREDHNSALDFMKYRTAESVQHPYAKFHIGENEFVSTYVDLFYDCPTTRRLFQEESHHIYL